MPFNDSIPEISDRPEAFDPGSILGDIEFDHVTFGYDPYNPVIKDVSLTIEAGQNIGIVGRSGSGKDSRTGRKPVKELPCLIAALSRLLAVP